MFVDTHAATTPVGIRNSAIIKRDNKIDAVRADAVGSDMSASALIAALESIRVKVVGQNVVATVDDAKYQYLTAEVLDVLTSDEIFGNGHICLYGYHHAVFFTTRRECANRACR